MAQCREAVDEIQRYYDGALKRGLPQATIDRLAIDLDEAKAKLQSARPVVRRLETLRQIISRKGRKLATMNAQIEVAIAGRDQLQKELEALGREKDLAELQYAAERHSGPQLGSIEQIARGLPALLGVIKQVIDIAQPHADTASHRNAIQTALDTIRDCEGAVQASQEARLAEGEGADVVDDIDMDPDNDDGIDIPPPPEFDEYGAAEAAAAAATARELASGPEPAPTAAAGGAPAGSRLSGAPLAAPFQPARRHNRGAQRLAPYVPGVDVQAALEAGALAQPAQETTPAALGAGGLAEAALGASPADHLRPPPSLPAGQPTPGENA